MRYPQGHKDEVREKILASAATLFRQHGFNGVGIDTIMNQAGLTRGGFYSHFKSKNDLFAAVLQGEHEYVTRLQRRPGGSRRALAAAGIATAKGYVAADNRDKVFAACSVAALSVDAARQDADSVVGYVDAVKGLIYEFERGLPDHGTMDERAVAAVIVSVGGLLLAQATRSDTDLSHRISAVASNLLEQHLQDSTKG